MRQFLQTLKRSKVLVPLLSSFIALAAYALIFPLYFAIGLIVMIFVHELGHVLAARHQKIPVSAPLFIPFIGAFIAMRRTPRDAETEAFVALGGPVIGSIFAVMTYMIGLALKEPKLIVMANIGFYLNLINLLPIHPLDGGRIVTAVSRWLWLAGILVGLGIVLYYAEWILFIFWIVLTWNVLRRWLRDPHRSYYTVSAKIRWSYGIAYGGMIILLLYMISAVSRLPIW